MSESALETPESNLQTVVFKVVPADVCMQWLAAKIRNAQQRVALQAMAVGVGEHTAPVFDAIEQKARQGDVHTRFIIDGYSLVFDDDQSVLLPTPRSHAARAAVEVLRDRLQALSEAGSDVAVVRKYLNVGNGIQRLNPYANRNHIKGHVIDDVVALAGPNLLDGATAKYDFLLVTEDKILADWWDAFTAYESQYGVLPSEKDYVVPIDDESHILVDVGVSGESLIYNTVCALLEADDVQSVCYINQLFPAGRILGALREAQFRLGVEAVEVLTSHYVQFRQPVHTSQRARQRNAGLTFYTAKNTMPVHTKTLLVTKTSGEQVAIVTSNNLDERGVAYGTAETAVVTQNAVTIANIREYCDAIPRQKFA